MPGLTDNGRIQTRELPYSRPFDRPLQAAWGNWTVRRGILLRMEDTATGRIGFGEAAPLPEGAAPDLSPGMLEAASIEFARWAASSSLEAGDSEPVTARTSALIPLDPEAAQRVVELRGKGIRTFKLKLGLNDNTQEWSWLQRLVTKLEPEEKLRLDPNRAWHAQDWQFWQPRLNGLAGKLEFIEEPFAEDFASREKMLTLADRSPVPIALDESLHAGNIEKWLQKGWPGYWIIKPAQMGNPEVWLKPLSSWPGKVILSSCFETGIGLSAIIRLARNFPDNDHGLGTQEWFADELGIPPREGNLRSLSLEEQEAIWKRLSTS